jgi:hypothetical protein
VHINSDTCVAGNACDHVTTITSINNATIGAGNAIPIEIGGFVLVGDTRNYVVAITSIERTGVENAAFAPTASNSVVTIAGIDRTGVVNAKCRRSSAFASADGTHYYVVTIRSIERARVENAVYCASGTDYVFSASDSVVTSKSISDASIKYFIYPRRGDNISLVGKR